ncbi:MAG: transglutaminase domain-containing protein [Candidatus Choladocola sp.]|nr:transglutaminase domain-containing protein [Candidatus Choladocola sp.]
MFLEKSAGRIEAAFSRLCFHQPELMAEIQEQIKGCSREVALSLKYLYCTMPCSDMGNYGFPIFYDYASHSVMLWKKYAYVRSLPEELFLNYVLYHRVNEEEIDRCRSLFYGELQKYGREELQAEDDWMTGKSMYDLAVEINFWCAGEVTYQSSDDRTASARTVFECGRGRCGEESVFAVNALRSAGLPARQVYAPKWSHCDDNHAWVEVWTDGEWHFLGACEPYPLLDRGWFNAAASRAMMVHSRWFDFSAPSDELQAGRSGMVTMLNQLDRYTDTVQLDIFVKEENGAPAAGAEVSFLVLNYGELAPIAVLKTDAMGKASIRTGCGGLTVEVLSGNHRAEAQIDTSQERSHTFILRNQERMTDERDTFSQNAVQEHWIPFDQHAPSDQSRPAKKLSPEAQTEFDRKLAAMVIHRLKKTERWENAGETEFLKRREPVPGLRRRMINQLSAKDHLDVTCDVLEEHLLESIPYMNCYPEDIFDRYVMNPRIDDEVLMKWRKAVGESFSAEEKERFRQQPSLIWDAVCGRIKEHPGRERSSVFTTPAAALKLGVAGIRSKQILFVAIARTLGIPARLNQEDQTMEYWKNGSFIPVLPEEKKDARLILTSENRNIVWKYAQNWTIGRMKNGSYETMTLGDVAWEQGKTVLSLIPGKYRILTANRLPNGNVFGNKLEFSLGSGETKEVSLQFREASLEDMISDYSLPDFEVKDETGAGRRASELAEKGKTLFLWLEESREPTEHILNELMERREEFGRFPGRIALMIRSGAALQDPTLMKCLHSLPSLSVYYHDFGEEAELLARSVFTEPERWPLILVAERKERGLTALYGTSGYNVGTGDMVLRIMNAE